MTIGYNTQPGKSHTPIPTTPTAPCLVAEWSGAWRESESDLMAAATATGPVVRPSRRPPGPHDRSDSEE